MFGRLKRLIKVSEFFTKLGWEDDRISSAMMMDLFLHILSYYQEQINDDKFDPLLSKRIDLVQALVDTYHD